MSTETKEFSTIALETYQRMREDVSEIYKVFPTGNIAEAKTEMHETVLALLASIFAADEKLKQSESNFLNAFLSKQRSLSENVEVLRSYLSKSQTLLSRVPDFVKQVAEFDKAAGNRTRYAAMLTGKLDLIGSCASSVDTEQSLAEQEILASYLARLDVFLAEEGVQFAGLTPGKRHNTRERFQALRDYQAAEDQPTDFASPPDKRHENENTSALSPQGKATQKQATGATAEKAVRSFEEAMADLDRLIGLKSVKQEVRTLASLIKIRKQRASLGLPNPTMSWHLVFSGNPGTGKTTVARLLSEIYRALGFLSKGHLVETDRSGLVGGYEGQTAIKAKGMATNAFGGVLFIDEAYSLSNSMTGPCFGQEAIETLLKMMEDNRQDMVVVVAGYTDKMEKFLQSNPGLESRFNRFILFEDYSPQELYDIFVSQCQQGGYTFDSEFGQAIAALLQSKYDNRSDNWGNARAVRNLFETLVANQANRLSSSQNPTRDELATFIIGDLPHLIISP